jgi:hypothetical protein
MVNSQLSSSLVWIGRVVVEPPSPLAAEKEKFPPPPPLLLVKAALPLTATRGPFPELPLLEAKKDRPAGAS